MLGYGEKNLVEKSMESAIFAVNFLVRVCSNETKSNAEKGVSGFAGNGVVGIIGTDLLCRAC